MWLPGCVAEPQRFGKSKAGTRIPAGLAPQRNAALQNATQQSAD